MVVDEAGSLHQSVADRGTDEAEPPPEQVLAELDREIGFGRDLFEGSPAILNGGAADEVPDESVEGAEFLLHL